MGGAGHVGLPLGLSFAAAGVPVVLFDINEAAVACLRAHRMPFLEHGGAELLQRHLDKDMTISSDPSCLSQVDSVICVIGTPIDEHLNPKVESLLGALDSIVAHLRPHQLLVLRST